MHTRFYRTSKAPYLQTIELHVDGAFLGFVFDFVPDFETI